MRRPIALLVLIALVVGACSKTDRPPIERVAGNIGASDQSGVSAGTDGTSTTASGGGGSATTGGSGAATTGGTSGSTGAGTAGAPAAGSSSDAAARAQAAIVALDSYLDALKAEDFVAAQRVSTGGPQFMVRVREVVARYNRERKGVTKLSYSARSFQVVSSEATKVSFTGSAKLDSSTSGPAGDPRSESSLFENPVVELVNGSWRVADYRFDQQPLVHFPASSHQSVGGVDLRMPGALSFGKSTGLIIDLISDGDHSLKVDKATLHYADGSTATPTLGALVSEKPAALYFLFGRKDSPPTSWTADITIDGGTKDEASSTVVLDF